MRKGTFAVAVPKRPDDGDIGAQLIVDLDVAALIDYQAGFIHPEIVGVRATADRQQKMRADDLGRTGRAIHRDRDPVAMPGDA